jgi:hypothetical protein
LTENCIPDQSPEESIGKKNIRGNMNFGLPADYKTMVGGARTNNNAYQRK